MKKLGNYFLQGLAFLVPVGLTAYVFVTLFRWLDGWLGAPVPGLGILVLAASVTILGYVTSKFVSRRAAGAIDSFLKRVPLAALVYSSVKDLMGAFVGEKKRFDKPVIVELDHGVHALGFLTRPSLEALAMPEHVAVYFPQAYNFAGQLAIVPRSRVRPAPMEGAQFMAFIVSAGVTSAGAPVSVVGLTRPPADLQR
ncbi:MAG: DUF502 domain-containing protein [Deltaproteobacteria bacterium]|nr:DUF502 domain-containing protein [Deltaproteobacteria bacterium]